jgi:secretion/DNA translocation related TadE-like protein
MMSSGRAHTRPERGSATLAAVVLLAAVLVATLVVTGAGSVVLARRQAGTAADLAAVAAAEAWVRGLPACTVAAAVVSRNAGTLRACRVDGAAVGVSVEVRQGVLGTGWTVSARADAWAGPVSARQ